jgi:hypothetical protein
MQMASWSIGSFVSGLIPLFLFFCFVSCTRSEAIGVALPEGWKKPEGKGFQAKWRLKNPEKFLSVGDDFNCDGLTDSAFILQPSSGSGVGLFVFLRDSSGGFSHRCLYDSRSDSANIKNLTREQKDQIQLRFRSIYGIGVVEKGLYKTACGKDYYDCEKNEPTEALLKCKGIDFFPYDSGGNIYYYWEPITNSFHSQTMSD